MFVRTDPAPRGAVPVLCIVLEKRSLTIKITVYATNSCHRRAMCVIGVVVENPARSSGRDSCQ